MELQNKIEKVAVFMEWKPLANTNSWILTKEVEGEVCAVMQKPLLAMHYHNDWKWLMKVTDKISGMYHSVKMNTTEGEHTCEILCYNEEGAIDPDVEIYISGSTLLEAVFEAAVEFVEWYNTNH